MNDFEKQFWADCYKIAVSLFEKQDKPKVYSEDGEAKTQQEYCRWYATEAVQNLRAAEKDI